MANLYVTGPVHIYVAVGGPVSGSSGQAGLLGYMSSDYIRYLGTCEVAPDLRIHPRWKPLMADVGGDEVPYDWAYNGEDATVAGVLTRWNEVVYAKCAARPSPLATRGYSTASDVGTLMLTEQKAYRMWLHFPYSAGKAYGATYNMPAGYRFFGAWMLGPDVIQGGTRPSKRVIAFQMGRVYSASNGTWTLYDHDMTNIPSTPPRNVNGILTDL